MDTEKELLERVADTRKKLADIERQWKQLRLQSREDALQLLTVHGYTLNRTSTVTGHQRQTLRSWLETYQASPADPSTRAIYGKSGA